MSKFNVYIKVPDYLDQWLRHEFWDDEEKRIKFPRRSAEHDVLSYFIARRPPKAEPDMPTAGALPIEVPTFLGRNPAQYNWLPKHGASALVFTIKKRFRKMLWDELHTIHSDNVQITDLVYAFLYRHGIEPTAKNWETVRQMYFRARKHNAPKK